jgi:hypothetical protein
MPNRLHRYYGAGYLHFSTTSCYQRRPRLGSRRNRDLFFQVLERVRRRYRFVVRGYVVMPEHIHLLLSEPERGHPSLVMQAVPESMAGFPLDAPPRILYHRENKSTLRSGPEFHAEWLRDEPYDATATDPGSYIPGAWCQLSPGNREHGIRNARCIWIRFPIASFPFPGKRGHLLFGPLFRGSSPATRKF